MKTLKSAFVLACVALLCLAGGAGAGVYGSLTYGAKGGVATAPAPLPLASDGLSVVVSGSTTASGGATSSNQTNGTQKTQVVDGSGNVQPAGDVATRPAFVQLTNGTTGLGSAANPVPVGSPDHSADASFTLAVWVQGSPVTTDSAPTNLASVSAGRVVRATEKRGSLAAMGFGGLRAWTVGPATATVTAQLWFYDDTLGVWVTCGAPVTFGVAAAGNGTVPAGGGPMIGARMYYQITAVANAPTAFGYDYF